MVRETGLFLAASTAASVIAALTCHWHVIHSRFIKVLISRVLESKNDHHSDDRLLIGAGNRT